MLRHYARRMPSIQYAYGAYVGGECVAVVTYGQPATNSVARSVSRECGRGFVIELNRLVVADEQPRNTASQVVGQSLRLLPAPKIVVSYADEAQGHVGYVYQATNFIYCGKTVAHHNDYIDPDGNKVHPRTLVHRGVTKPEQWVVANGWTKEKPHPKHRYVYLVGNKTEKKTLAAALVWESQPYPKGPTRRYEASREFAAQNALF